MAQLFLADPSLPDHTAKPIFYESEDGEEVVFTISQSRSSSKLEGQDSIASSLRGRYECCVLCDGHDLHGHLVARGICETLSTLLLDKLEGVGLETKEAEDAILRAFEETESRVMWSNAQLQPNSFVRVIEGEWAGRVGYVSEVHDQDDTFSIIVVDSEAYHRPRLPRQYLTGSRFVGGSTCVAFVRDSVANLCRIAVMGDTRAMVIHLADGYPSLTPGQKNPPLGLEKDPIWENLGKNAYLTFPHDVFNTAELARLKSEWHGEYEIDGPYLINPLTGCEIQPTRGFGDFDMFGTGYLSIPDVSQAFPVLPGNVILVGSDGIFDDNVWQDFGMVADFLTHQLKSSPNVDLETIAANLHAETVVRGKKSGYVDDISFFMCRVNPTLLAERANNAPNNNMNHNNPAAMNVSNLLPPRPPGRSHHAESGVDGLPTPASSFVSLATGPRESASFTEIANNRRISQGLSLNEEKHSLILSTPPPVLSNPISKMKRHSTADFIDPNAPRYLKESRSETATQRSEHDTIRRTRGPSFMLPEGLEAFVEGSEEDDVTLAVIAEDGELETKASKHQMIKKKSSSSSPPPLLSSTSSGQQHLNGGGAKHSPSNNNTPTSSFAFSLASSSLASTKPHPRPSMNAVLQRMAARYGHDPKQLDSLVRDLSVV